MNAVFKIAFLEVSWVDLIDITMVAILLYQVYKLIQDSIAFDIFMGILALYFLYLIVNAAQMELLSTILGQFMGIGMLAALILFQQEIRKFLLVIGKRAEVNRETLIRPFTRWKYQQKYGFSVGEIIQAIKVLKATCTGALMVLSRDSEMKFYIETGELINSMISQPLLVSIFNKHSPLHDGAVIIHKGHIKAARCVLPVSENQNLPPHYGLRHRAAIGITELSNSLSIVVSEEKGNVMISRSGMYIDNMDMTQIEKKILEYLEDKEP